MITGWEANFTGLEAKITDLKLVEGALLSLSLFLYLCSLSLSLYLFISPSVHLSLCCFLSPLLSLSARPFFLCCSASGRDPAFS